ncbi:hypothetical protein E4T56_gene20870 [Termitomyces sp. T112]|nr:hypothetical protein E4T56_gene20870 [Termitomyces sp. T112]
MIFLIAFITVPYNGVLVRYRLAYHPKESLAAAIDPEAGNEVGFAGATSALPRETVATQPTFFGVAKRIYQIEGISGFYKGIIPAIITHFFMWISARNYMTRLYISPAPSTSTVTRTLTQSFIGTLFYSFALVCIYRSITTRTKLEVFGNSIKDGIRTLFTRFERARPYSIVTPSLLSALLGQILLQEFFFHPLRQMVSDQATNDIDSINFLCFGAYSAIHLVNTLICAPLDVIVTRLAVQHNYGSSDVTTKEPMGTDPTVPHEMDEKCMPSTHEVELDDNLAIRYRGDDLEVYTNVYDCAMKIIKEEGWMVLYRGWFITCLGKIYS